MSWQGIHGHDDVIDQFRRSLARGRLASTFLFVGPSGIGKRSLALQLAKGLLCHHHAPERLEPCNACPSCLQVEAGTHPDLLLIRRPEDKSVLPVELFIGPRERRMQEGLCHDIRLKPFMGGRRVAIIDDADALNEESANCLLKTLEEPPPNSVMILIGTSADRQLPTIRSRAQIVRFSPLDVETVAELLSKHELVADAAEARRLAAHAGGSLDRALALADADLWAFRQQLLGRLAAPTLESVPLAKAVIALVDSAGKEAPARRARARQVFAFAAEFYRQLARACEGAPPTADAELNSLVAQAQANWPGDAETAAACAQRTLEALDQLDRNANQATLIECWLDDLARLIPAPAA